MSVRTVSQVGRSLPAYANTAGRAVHIKIHPQPRNLSESTEVLRVLQQYGEVVMYKHLKHEPNRQAANTALAIYQNTTSAQNVISASPLHFQLQRPGASLHSSNYHGSNQAPAVEQKEDDSWANREQPEPENSHDEQEWLRSFGTSKGVMREPLAGETSPTGPNARNQGRNSGRAQANSIPTSASQTPKPFTPNPTPSSTLATSLPFPPSPCATTTNTSETENREFRLTVSRSVLNHQAYIQRQHYYGGFRLDDKNIMAEDLEARVPVKGLADCQIDKGESPLRVRMKREDARGEQRKTLGELWREAQLKREGEGEKDTWSKSSPSNDDAPTTVASEGLPENDRASPRQHYVPSTSPQKSLYFKPGR